MANDITVNFLRPIATFNVCLGCLSSRRMPNALSEDQLKLFREYEPRLRMAARHGHPKEALKMVLALREAMLPDKRHSRLLRANCYYYDALINTGRAANAIPGLKSIRKDLEDSAPFGKVSSPVAYVEATMLLSICFLRGKDFKNALPLIEYVISHYNETGSVEKRRRWQRDYIERIQHEVILAHMIVPEAQPLLSEDVEAKAAELINQNIDEVYDTLENALPGKAKQLMLDVTDNAIPLLTAEDRMALPGPINDPEQISRRKPVVATLRELGWRLVCDPDSFFYQQWVKDPKLFYGAVSIHVATLFNTWQIPTVLFAGGVASEIMRFRTKVFCENNVPATLLVERKGLAKKDD